MSFEEATASAKLRSFPMTVLRRVRRSFLLMVSAFGLFLAALAGLVIAPLGHNILAGVLGASGLVMFVANIFWYLMYKLGEWYFG